MPRKCITNVYFTAITKILLSNGKLLIPWLLKVDPAIRLLKLIREVVKNLSQTHKLTQFNPYFLVAADILEKSQWGDHNNVGKLKDRF